MLDRVVDVVGGNLDRQADAVTVELLDLCLHRRAIESERVARSRAGARAAVALRAMERRGRRSARAARTRPSSPSRSPREVVEELLELARWAPNHHLTEPWRFRVLGPETFERLVAAGRAERALEARPRADARRREREADRRRAPEPRGRARDRVRRLHRPARRARARPRLVLAHADAARDARRAAPPSASPTTSEFVALIHLGDPATTPPAKERAPVERYVSFLP